MAYSQKVLNHYENPKNVGSFAKEEKNVGTGLVGAPACGDVMKLQIKVSDDGIIEDACFKTFGCLPSNNLIATPKGYVAISKLCAGDEVWAWNGVAIVKNLVKSNIKSATHYSRLLKLDFGLRKTITCTDDHVWWLADNRPIEAKDLTANMELLCATKNEFKSLNNVGKQEWMRQIAAATVRNTNTTQNIHARACFQTQRVSILPKFCATFWQNFAAVSGILQKILPKNEPKFGQKRNVVGLKTGSRLPQNQKGYQHNDAFKAKISQASKQNWSSPEYVKNWQIGMNGASQKRPTKLEQIFIELFDTNQIDARYVGNGSFWVNCQNGAKLNPDFKVNKQRKVIEVYDSNMPNFMMNRKTQNWMIERKQQFAEKGYDVMFIESGEATHCLTDVQRFIHNGIELRSIHNITDRRDLRGLERKEDNVFVYDLTLEEGANIFFVQRVMSHNCGSAIASSSLATEWIKGQKIDEAKKVTNKQIAEELSLPPVKIHCSVLAEEAIKAAIEDYKKRKNAE
ncbi:MAG: hypothetical protein A2887_04310 [Alphaproteobacteria bacterium RIFCSPLOWO2_01_FULL_40_26]|nr:MAG: hypothetical protein A3D15_01495 [Alphaproteobacteria bacterium RIFCSPHIGHO2_02_FULL_40_34]OFW86938.1 MAG: hypothetical protein A2794_00430 [Alphaproteobacteria bacterium RIFCSPHIGHO2_01_FULL_40_8]OFW94448.1 MAG: hypothetical protein A2887_04310 [Alphaproteobacteria bacterium RIFCSPLOWO2_01_FULL_40_26]OFX09518.1 MAG: hypothetical protein A3H30_05510 [Alphaproteobacteria bacterium RIFCSPLOWO2_02_FULL_40_19]OFX10668.1 MAG: hypothetical protein A3G22_06770 [Alphaproteobacteria bacterium RI